MNSDELRDRDVTTEWVRKNRPGLSSIGAILTPPEHASVLSQLERVECLESIVRDFARSEPFAWLSVEGHEVCALCDQGAEVTDEIVHREDCLWRRAVEVENAKKAQ